MKRRFLLKKRKKFFLVVFTSSLLITTLFLNSVYGYKEPSYKHITIKSGDNLWSIALENYTGGDIREYIYKIQKTNNMNTSEIYAGNQLKIPIE
jgi:hypothetical protein